jgi:hypothetical protein
VIQEPANTGVVHCEGLQGSLHAAEGERERERGRNHGREGGSERERDTTYSREKREMGGGINAPIITSALPHELCYISL